MEWTKGELKVFVTRGHEAQGNEGWISEAAARAIADLAVELAAVRGGTMTAGKLQSGLDLIDPLLARRIGDHITALGARNAVLEAEVQKAGPLALEVLSLRAEGDTLQAELRQARLCIQELRGGTRETVHHLEQQRDTLRSELAEAHATIARLTAAGQALSDHVDRTTGQCSNPDPTTGPTCAERGCEGQTCQYPKAKPAPIPDPCNCGGEEHHTFHCPARTLR